MLDRRINKLGWFCCDPGTEGMCWAHHPKFLYIIVGVQCSDQEIPGSNPGQDCCPVGPTVRRLTTAVEEEEDTSWGVWCGECGKCYWLQVSMMYQLLQSNQSHGSVCTNNNLTQYEFLTQDMLTWYCDCFTQVQLTHNSNLGDGSVCCGEYVPRNLAVCETSMAMLLLDIWVPKGNPYVWHFGHPQDAFWSCQMGAPIPPTSLWH